MKSTKRADGRIRPKEDNWSQLVESHPVREQQAAFACATGLPLTLLPVSGRKEGVGCCPEDKAFCVEGCLGDGSGSLCSRALNQAEQRAAKAHGPVTFRCPAGLMKILMPVLVRQNHLGNLLAGPFSVEEATAEKLRRIVMRLKQHGLERRAGMLDESWQHAPKISTHRGRAVATLVRMFADYLAECGNQMLLRQPGRKSEFMERVEAFLAAQRTGEVSLKSVAERVNLSPCHFCRVFKKQTGLTFSDYWTRMRVERVKELLLAGRLRVSEAAFEAGFNSIPYFNRAFRRYVGCSPKEFLARNAGAK